MSGRLLKFLEKEKMLFPGQFVFRSNRFTDFAILTNIDKVQQAIDQGDPSCGILLDFSKAFDTVDHAILIEKGQQLQKFSNISITLSVGDSQIAPSCEVRNRPRNLV